MEKLKKQEFLKVGAIAIIAALLIVGGYHLYTQRDTSDKEEDEASTEA